MFAEMMGRESGPVSRAQALSVPAVQRGRNMICSISTLPLTLLDSENQKHRSPLLQQLDPDVPNVVTLAQTVEDLLFDGIAWWLVTAQDFAGYPMAVRHLDPSSVSLQPPADANHDPLPSGVDPRRAVVWVNGDPVPAERIIRFDSPNPPLLRVAGSAIRRAILLDKAARMYAADPRPLDYFTPADGADPASDDEIEQLLAQWKAARQRRSTAYVPAALEYHSVDSPSPAELQLVELQRQATLDIANALGLDPEDIGISTTSRTYQNAIDRRRDRINDVLAPFMRAITDRLSMGDVTRRGYRVTFDLDDYLKANPTERWLMYEKALNLGVMDVSEVRAREDLPPAEPAVTEPPVTASTDATHRFDRSGLTFADVATAEFSVDRESRTIEGLALPYGRVAAKGGLRFRFAPGSIRWSDVGRVKLLRDHDPAQPLGRAVDLSDGPAGLYVKFRVARGPEGDRALELAEDGVLDGLSVGVDFDAQADAEPDPADRSVLVVRRADLREVSLTPMPSFDDARVTSVAASLTAPGDSMSENTTPEQTAPETTPEAPETARETFSADQVREIVTAEIDRLRGESEGRRVVDPTRTTSSVTFVREALPYRFDRAGRFVKSDYEFSTDLRDMALAGDVYGNATDAGRRVMGLLRATFDVDSADVNELNPAIQRPDMYVDQRDYRYPLWNFVNKGAPPNGIQPFTFPKFNSASGLVGDHTEGVEPSSGSFTTTSQTVTPTPISGKASITREVWDMGGNPAVSTLIFNQMVRGYREGLEQATATFLNTLTAATDISITAGATDETLAAAWDAALAALQFERGYNWEALALEKNLYLAFVAARDDAGRVLYPQVGPSNANGTAARRFLTLDLGGVVGVPAWALPTDADPTVSNNSWLFDPSVVHGWATAPQRLEFPGTDGDGGYAPVAMVDIAIWGYKAFACSDIGGVRQITYAAQAGGS